MSQRSRQTYLSPNKQKIFYGNSIYNQNNAYQNYLRYNSSMQQKPNLDYKDHKLIIPFKERLTENITILKQDQWKIRQWLTAVVQLINSDSFRKYSENILSLDETKTYASQNIILNFHLFMQKLDQFSLDKQYRVKVLNFISQESLEIVKYGKLKYPQNSSSSSFRRFQKQVSHRDNSQEEQFSLLYAVKKNPKDKEKLQFIYQNDYQYDYKKTIMQVINYLIELPSKKFDSAYSDQDQLTNYMAFQMMVNAIFKSPKKVVQKLQKLGFIIPTSKFKNKKQMSSSQHQKLSSEKVEVLDKQQQIISPMIKPTYQKLGKQEGFKQFFSEIQQDGCQKKDCKIQFSANRKIPDYVKPFTDQQIETGDFKLKHSSILRIITKWVQQLQKNIDNIDQFINRKITNNTKEQSIGYTNNYKNYEKDINDQINRQVKNIEQNRAKYKQHFAKIREEIFSSQFSGKYINSLDTNVGIIAGRVQLCLSEYILRELNDLIHCFLKSIQKHKQLDLFLITLKLGDLMRAKISADQEHIIDVHRAMEVISKICPQLFQIIQVKNRLEKKDKDVLINFMFMKKIICQIQLSVKSESNEKNKKLNQFNHFLYELQRAQFGVIAEASCIAAKNNPIFQKQFQKIESQSKLKAKPIQRQKQKQIKQKVTSKQKYFNVRHKQGSKQSQKKQQKKNKQNDTLPFICQSQTCHQLQKKQKKILNTLQQNKYFAAQIQKNPQKCRKCILQQIKQEHEKISNNFLDLSLQISIKEKNQDYEIKKELIKKHFQLVVQKEKISIYEYGILIKKTDHLLKCCFYKFLKYGNQIFLYKVEKQSQSLANKPMIFQVFSIKKKSHDANNIKYAKEDLQKFQQKMAKYYIFKAKSEECIVTQNKQVKIQCKCETHRIPSIKLYDMIDQSIIKQNDNLKYFQKIKQQRKIRLDLIDRVIDKQNINNFPNLFDVRKVYADSNTKNLFLTKNFSQKIKYTQFLDLKKCDLQDPDFLNLMPNLWHLNISGNNIKSFQNVKLDQLRQLYVDHNKLSEIPAQFPNLTILRMSQNQNLKNISIIQKLQKLVKLSLHSCNNLKTLQAKSECLPKLQKLHLSECNGLVNINFDGIFQNIKLLNCENCLQLLQVNLRNCPNLQQISCLNNQKLKEFSITQNKQLKKIHLSKVNQETVIRLDFSKHNKVKQVKITESKLKLTHIQNIDLAKQTLEYLNLQKNNILNWTKILTLNWLKKLNLQNNALQDQFNCINFSSLPHLVDLNIKHCNLVSIQGLQLCKSLEDLQLYPQKNQKKNTSPFDLLKLPEKFILKQLELINEEAQSQKSFHKKVKQKAKELKTHGYFDYTYKQQFKKKDVMHFYLTKNSYIPKIRLDRNIDKLHFEGNCLYCNKKTKKLSVCLTCTFKTELQDKCPVFDQNQRNNIKVIAYCFGCIQKITKNKKSQEQQMQEIEFREQQKKLIQKCSCHCFLSIEMRENVYF